MIDAEEISEMWSPFLNYLVKLEKELKCFICNGLFRIPRLLPCNHIVCSDCIITPLTSERSVCLSCQNPFRYEDTRHVFHVERMVSLFQEMDAAIGGIIQQSPSPKSVPGDEGPGVHNAKDKPSHSGSHGFTSANYRNPERRVDEGNNETMPDRSTNFEEVSGIEEHFNLKESCYRTSFGENSGSKLHKHDSYPKQNLKASSRMKNGASRLKNFKKAKKPKNANTWNDASGRILFGDECAFCHSFRITEASGPMYCYKDGKLSDLEEANQSNGIYVHEKCVVWAPQVYFSGEIVKNFELELKRASKINCSKCGLKGAALGCYDNNCHKSYHVTCAVQIPDCRWDCDNFHVLCPSHSKKKLPCDDDVGKNDDGTHLQSIQTESSESSGKLKDGQSNDRAAAMDVSNEMIFMGSDLIDSEKNLLVELASLIGGKVTERWTPEVTHVIVSTSEDGACRRTHDFLLAVLNWKWILTTKWVKVSLELGHLVEEEPFEVRFDERGFEDGPKKRRHRIIEKAKNLFAGLSFYISEHFDQSSEQSLRELVGAAGGKVLEVDCLMLKDPSPNSSSFESFLYFIYDEYYPKDYNARDFTKIDHEKCEEVVDIFLKTGARAVSNNGVLDAIATLDVKYLDVIYLNEGD